jgi:uroporphyrin-III C-methyltransferase / precorrin-2 dehydrogenase / sirohydrochlorin ferrochelatase
MDFLPAFLNVRERPAAVVGGGAVALRKAELLVRCGARVTLVAPHLTADFSALLASGCIEHRATHFTAAALDGAAVVIAATDQPSVNAAVAQAARARNIPVNVVDDLHESSFIVPAIVDRDPVIVAVGTSGNAPVLARFVRERIEALLPPQLGKLAALAGRWRRRVGKALGSVLERRRFWERVFAGPVATQVFAGHAAHAELELRRELKHAAAARSTGVGEVYLVGAGPGDPDLLTLKAARLLQQADVVLYDRLIPEAVLDRARRDAERIYVGKEAGRHHVTQEETQQLMIELALQGKRVCRLKGGDPFVFGRGGEELEALIAHHIPVTVVPGITAALGAAACAGIPLTHRDHAHAVTFATGHAREGGAAPNWHDLARPGQTVVFYMGLTQLPTIVAELTGAGAPLDLPAAVVEQATLPGQRVIAGTLRDLSERVAAAQVRSPALLIVGEVVALHALAAATDPLTPTLSPEAGARAHSSLPLPLAGEGWGERNLPLAGGSEIARRVKRA